MSKSLFHKKETSTHTCCDFFTNIFFYRTPPVAVSSLNLFNLSNSKPNSGRSLFINYVNPIGPWGPKPNNKIITSITSDLSFVLELPKAYYKDTLRKTNVLVNAYWYVKVKFDLLSKFYIVFDTSSTIFKFLFVLLVCMNVIVDSK